MSEGIGIFPVLALGEQRGRSPFYLLQKGVVSYTF